MTTYNISQKDQMLSNLQNENTPRSAAAKDQLNRFSVEPMYEQLAAIIERAIAREQFKPGERIGTEKELCETFGVSRITVRQAIDVLVEKDLLVRRHGKGTYVARARIRHDIDTLNQLLQTHYLQDDVSSSLLLEFGTRQAPEHINGFFEPQSGEPVSLTRLTLHERTPISVGKVWLLPLARQLSEEQARQTSTSALLTKVLGLTIAKTEYVIRIGMPEREAARLLGIRDNAIVISLTRRRYLPDGSLAEYLTGTLLPDFYELSFTSVGDLPGHSVARYLIN